MNEGLKLLGESPCVARKFGRSNSYATKKCRKVQNVFKTKLQKIIAEKSKLLSANDEQVTTSDDEDVNYDEAGKEMLKQLREKFIKSTNMEEKLIILSVAPSSWSISKLMTYFGATRHMVDRVKEDVKTKEFCAPLTQANVAVCHRK